MEIMYRGRKTNPFSLGGETDDTCTSMSATSFYRPVISTPVACQALSDHNATPVP